MLTIRKGQFDVIRKDRDRILAQELIGELQANFPEETRGQKDSELGEHICKAFAQARRYGLQGKRDLVRFVNLTVLFGLGWDEQKETLWMHETLIEDNGEGPSEKLQWLVVYCVHRLEAGA